MQEMNDIMSGFTRSASMPSEHGASKHDFQNWLRKPTQIYDFSDSPGKSGGGIRISQNGTNTSQFEAGFLPVLPLSPKRQGIRISDNGANRGSMGTGFSLDPDSRQRGIRVSQNGTNAGHLESGLTLSPEARGQGIRISSNGTNTGHFDHGFMPMDDNRKSGGIRMSGNGPNKSHFTGFVSETGPQRRISGAGSGRPLASLEFVNGGLSHHGDEQIMKSKARTSLSGSMSGQLSSELMGPDSPLVKSSPYAGQVSKSAVFSGEDVPFRRLSHPSENGQNTFSSSVFKEVELKQPTKRHAGAATQGHMSSSFEVVKEPAPKPLNSTTHAGKMTESHFSLYSPVK